METPGTATENFQATRRAQVIQLAAYLVHLLRLAGTELPLFEPAALEAIYHATSGLPRKVNLLAHHALTTAALAKAQAVTAEHVQAALPEVS